MTRQRMAGTEWIVVTNPRARCGRRVLRRIERALAAPGIGAAVRWVSVQELAGTDPGTPARLIVAGGDGTVRAAFEWLHRRRLSTEVAIVPAGTGNNLARGLGLPLEPARALALALGGAAARPIDAIRVEGPAGGDTVLVQSGAFGFPAEVAASYERWRQRRLFRLVARPLGGSVYHWLALSRLARARRAQRQGKGVLQLCCRFADEALETAVLAVFLGNEKSLGGGFLPCPHAAPDDGLLDLCLVHARPDLAYLRLFRRIARGEHVGGDDAVTYRQTPGPVELEFSAPTPFLVDGDVCGVSARYRLEVLPRRFLVVGARTSG